MDHVVLGLLVLCTLLVSVSGHGRLLDPPSRSSMWRFGLSSAVNYNDNQLPAEGSRTNGCTIKENAACVATPIRDHVTTRLEGGSPRG